ncbi:MULTISPECIES: UV DNA damage repair endonuclease UvsE [Bacillus]|uniref:UV DNA damage repair endonuclease UvsE n=1 Tax=Bacillus TaxID=1386 RepID=UPI0002FF9270|nr:MULTISPECIES: UV DNA damage repair endonuclease UvsE [Bacillus]
MTIFRFGYVAMSMHVKNASPSKTMTYSQFVKIADYDAAIAKLVRIARTNLHNCLRLLRHNEVHDIHFFRFSSKLIPLVNHPEIEKWDYIAPLKEGLSEIRSFIKEHPFVRVDFHPDHFVVLNTKDKHTFSMSLKTLQMHYLLLRGMGIAPKHRCVLHVGGGYEDKEQALERFIYNWSMIPPHIQGMLMLENDDTTFTLKDTLYVCEKLGVPLVFDYHHYLVNHEEGSCLQDEWKRIIKTWSFSPLPIKVHISSPRSNQDYRAHADGIDLEMFWEFVQLVKGTVEQVDVMIEAKLKDEALFQLMKDIRLQKNVQWINDSSFIV